MKKLSFLSGVLLIIAFCTNQNPETTLMDYLKAHNEHAVREALSYYHPDIIFEVKGALIKEGKTEVRSLEVWDSTLNSNLKLESLEIKKDSAFGTVIENNDWFAAVGIKDIVHDSVVFTFEADKIKSVTAYPSEETGNQIQQIIGSLFQWSDESRDSTIYSLMPGGKFIYSSESAVQWLDLFKRSGVGI